MSDPEAEFQAATAHIAAGRRQEAEAIYQRLIAGNPRDARALAGLGTLAFEVRQYDEAIRLYEQALETDGGAAPTQVRLGTALNSAGRFGEARQAFEKAVALAGDRATPHYYLAVNLASEGDFEGARRHALEAIRLDRFYGPAYQLLGSAKTYRIDQELIDRMERLAGDQATPETARMHIHYALGRIMGERGAAGQSFAHLDEANRIERQACDYKASDMGDYFAFIRDVFDQRLVGTRAPGDKDRPRPIFIVGMPRSGTTLIEQILSSHSEVYGAAELTFLHNDAVMALNELANAPFPKAMSGLTPQQLAEAAQVYISKVEGATPRALAFTDKNPANYQLVGMIYMLFPEARVIHIRRRPMDVCYSIYKHYFGQNTPYYCAFEDMAEYFGQYRQLMSHWRKLLPAYMLEIDYENLVRDFDPTARRIVSFCGLEWQDSCLDFHLNKRVITTMSKAQVRRPLYTSSIDAWKEFAEQLEPLAAALTQAGVIIEEAGDG